MATLTGELISETYDSLLKVTDNNTITGVKKRITDGFGNEIPLQLSSTDIEIDGTLILSALTDLEAATKFLSLKADNSVSYRTASEVLTDIGGASSSSISGTTGNIAKFTSTGAVGNSILEEIGNVIHLTDGTSSYASFGIINPGVDNDAYIGSTINNDFLIRVNNTEALRIDTALRLTIANIQNATTDTDKFLVSDGGVVKYRTGTELRSDIGAGVGSVTSVGLTMPVAFSVANSPITSSGTLEVTAIGSASQYIRGDGTLATIPSTSSGGANVNYYLNGSIAASVATYKQMANSAIIGGGTDFNLTGNGLIAQFLTDAGNPNRLLIPGGAWNFEMYFNISSSGGNSKFYVELLKYNGTTFTSIASSSAVPEEITGGTTTDLYITSLAVPETVLLITDRLALRVYIVDNSGGRTVTLHTEDNTLCLVTTTFAGGIAALNGLTANTQYFATGTTGSDFNISSVLDTHTFNIPSASATARGLITTSAQTITGSKTFESSLYIKQRTGAFVVPPTGYSFIGSSASGFWFANKSATPNFQSVEFDLSSLTDATVRTYVMPNANGTLALVGGVGVGTVTSVAALTLGTSGTDLNSSVANGTTTPVITLNVPDASATNRGALSSANWTTFNNKENVLSFSSPLVRTLNTISIPAATSTINGYLSSTDWTTFNSKQNTITLTTTGTSGAATFISNTLNIPQYTVLSLAAIGITPNANGASIVGSLLNLQPASASFGGVVTTGTQTFAGAKTFSGSSIAETVNIQNSGTGYGLKVQSGGAYFQDDVTIQGFLKSVSYTYTLPSATGTLALTSNITSAISGTTNYIPKFTGANTIGNSQIFDNGTNVGIGTATPLSKFGVKLSTATAVSTIVNTTGWDSTYAVFGNPDSVSGQGFAIGVSNTLNGINLISLNPTADWVDTNYYSLNHIFYGGSTERMRIKNGGNVLIGTTTDAGYKLDVNGTGRFSGKLISNGPANDWGLVVNGSSTLGQSYGVNIVAGSNSSDVSFLVSNYVGADLLRITGTGAATFSSTINIKDPSWANVQVAKSSIFGYSSSYTTTIIGGIGTSTLAFNVDVSANPSGAFGGSGNEYLWRNSGAFMTPNASNNGFNTLLSWNSSGQLTVTGAATFSSSVTATAFFESSDSRLKTLITDNHQAKGIESITAKLYTKNGVEELGYFAQDVQSVLPSAVIERDDTYLDLSYRQVHTAKIANLEKEIKELKDLIKQLI
jgi:hypothetical protein